MTITRAGSAPKLLACFAAFFVLLVAAPAIAEPSLGVGSPDGRIAVTLSTNAEHKPTWQASIDGRAAIAPSLLGLQMERYAELSTGLVATASEVRTGRDRYRLIVGKTAAVDEAYHELTVHYAEPGPHGRRIDLIVRAYNSGVALRYRLPVQPQLTSLRLVNELTQFAFPADYACTGLNLGSFGTSHEGEFDSVAASLIRPHNLYELPLVCRTSQFAFAIAEADVDGWPASYLSGIDTGAAGVAVTLTRQPDDPDVAVTASLDRPILTPWRVVMIADRAGALIENTLLTSLNPPAEGDFSWVKPGKTAWDWWSGPVLSSVPVAGTNDATERAFVDFAAQHAFAYAMVDDGWYHNSGDGRFLNPGADPTKPIAALDLPALVRYAQAKGVGIIVWVHWRLLDRAMEPILRQLETWGIKGIKVDFMDRDDQAMIAFYHRLAAATARHHLLLDLHGATHPWGMTRTWPNFITQEGVLGAEYNKWTRRITAHHNITLAYTRLLTGPMDYTPGGYRNRTPSTFRITATAPETQTTRGAALAMYVIYESPLQSVADSPDAYRGQPGLDFLSAVPTSWDETRFLQGEPGEDIVLARRKGDIWYIGAMTETARTVRIPLTFLGDRRFRAHSWSDGATPTTLDTATREIGASDSLTLRLAASGGGVAMIEPIR